MRRPGFSGTSTVAGALFAAGLLFAGAAPAQSPPAPATPEPPPTQAPSAQAPSAPPPAQAPSAQAPSATPSAQAPSAQAPEGLPPASSPVSPHVVSLQKGQQLLDAGRHLEAAYALANALRGAMGDPSAPRDLRVRIAAVLQEARSHIGVLYVVAGSGQEVKVDGVPVGTAPIAGEVLIVPGKHRVVARGALCLGSTDVEVLAGESRRVKVPCPTAPAWRTPVLIAGLTSALVGLAAGGVTLAASEDRRKQLDFWVEETRAQGFVDPGIRSLVLDHERNRVDLLNASITSFLIGGSLLAATTAVFFGVKRRRPDEPPPLVGATVGAGQAGLWMRW